MKKLFLLSLFASALSVSVAQANVKIATVGPMTGQYAMFGEQMKNGFNLAIEDLNAKGGVLGQKVEGIVGDDVCDPKQAVSVANQLVGENVAFVAGHFCSGSTIPASVVYDEEGIIMMTPASTNVEVTERGLKHVFRFVGRDNLQGAVASQYIIDNFKDKTIAIAHDKVAYSKGLAEATKKGLNDSGIKEVFYETITPGEQDYSALVSKIKENNVDLLYYGGYHTEAGLIIRQMRKQGINTVLFSGDALVGKEFWAITGDQGKGTLMTFGPDPRRNPDSKEIVKRLQDKGIDPEGYTVYTYGTVQVWADAVKKAGSFDAAAVKKALHENEFETVIGTIRFDEKGDFNAPGYVVYRWENGEYTPVDQ